MSRKGHTVCSAPPPLATRTGRRWGGGGDGGDRGACPGRRADAARSGGRVPDRALRADGDRAPEPPGGAGDVEALPSGVTQVQPGPWSRALVLRADDRGGTGAPVGAGPGGRRGAGHPPRPGERRPRRKRADTHGLRLRAAGGREQPLDRRRGRLLAAHHGVPPLLPGQLAGGRVGAVADADLPDAGVHRAPVAQHPRPEAAPAVRRNGRRRRAAGRARPRGPVRRGTQPPVGDGGGDELHQGRAPLLPGASTSASASRSTRCRASPWSRWTPSRS